MRPVRAVKRVPGTTVLVLGTLRAGRLWRQQEPPGESPFPNAFDPASSREAVLEAVSQFIDSGDPGNGTDAPDGNETTMPPSETPSTETTTSRGNEST
ncbi:hypothetical protein [Halobellus ruber]|uniref:hypothetical protein n=1 Tax=Halobellus ruber TaxID=2761102 RepID=UPI001FE53135|nr:hypothetical protein [Halobellus ruber]